MKIANQHDSNSANQYGNNTPHRQNTNNANQQDQSNKRNNNNNTDISGVYNHTKRDNNTNTNPNATNTDIITNTTNNKGSNNISSNTNPVATTGDVNNSNDVDNDDDVCVLVEVSILTMDRAPDGTEVVTVRTLGDFVRPVKPTIKAGLLAVPWSLLPFVFSMFVLVEGLRMGGWVELFAQALIDALGGMYFIISIHIYIYIQYALTSFI